jgi:hypothetical protein
MACSVARMWQIEHEVKQTTDNRQYIFVTLLNRTSGIDSWADAKRVDCAASMPLHKSQPCPNLFHPIVIPLRQIIILCHDRLPSEA